MRDAVGSFDSPNLWPDATRSAIEEALTTSAEASYSTGAQLIIDLNWQNTTEEVHSCAADGCGWAVVWYSVPEAVTRPI